MLKYNLKTRYGRLSKMEQLRFRLMLKNDFRYTYFEMFRWFDVKVTDRKTIPCYVLAHIAKFFAVPCAELENVPKTPLKTPKNANAGVPGNPTDWREPFNLFTNVH